MSLTLYYHPLSSFCWKALIALYEADVEFTPRVVNLGDPADRAAFQAVWPLAKFPVLVEGAAGHILPGRGVCGGGPALGAQPAAGRSGAVNGHPPRRPADRQLRPPPVPGGGER